jgi:hypothetical protein
MAITSTSLSLATTNIYTSSLNSVVSVMYFCNQGGSTANLTVSVTAGNLTAGTANVIYKDILIATADTFVVDMEKLVLSDKDFISANSGGTVSATVSYVGI